MTSDHAALDEATVDAVEAFVDDWRETHDVPGVGVALVDEDGVTYGGGFGVRNRESGAPASPDTLFAVGSVAKPVTAVAVLQLVDRGDLALDDEIRRYVDVLTDVPGEPITVRELLSHSSGMPRDFVAQFAGGEDGTQDLVAYVDGAADQRLTDRPRYMYYNSGYFLLAEVIEAVDGRPYPTYVAEEVFGPLGMDRSGVDPGLLATDDDAMTGYVREDGDLVPSELDHDAGASGGLVSSVHQLAALLRCVLNDGSYEGNRLLSPGTVDEMCRVQSPLLPTADGTRRGYGYGWELDEFLGETLVSHRGGIGVSGGYVGVLRDRGVGVALAYNALGQPTIPYGQGVLALACGERPADAVPLLNVYAAVDAVTGSYVAYADAVTVTVEAGPAGTIEVTLPRGATFTATPDAVDATPYTFSQTMGGGVRWVAEFRAGEAGMELVLSTGKWTARLADDD